MCSPFALWSSFRHACKPHTVAERELYAAHHALTEALAGAALDARATSREHQALGRAKWHACTLAFSDKALERAFQKYYAHLRSGRMRTGMLVVGAMYILYAMLMWQGAEHSRKTELYLRVGYLVFLFSMFITSFTTTWHKWSQLGSMIVASVTLIEALSEASILDNFLGPTTLVINVLFMLAWNIFVRFRFLQSVALCSLVGVSFFVIAVVSFRGGDSVVSSDDASRYIIWDTGVLLFVAVLISKMSHRMEVASRYNFLSNMRKASWMYMNQRSGPHALEDTTAATDATGAWLSAAAASTRNNNDNTLADLSAEQKLPQTPDRYRHPSIREKSTSSLSASSLPPEMSLSVRKHLVGSPLRRPDIHSDEIPNFSLRPQDEEAPQDDNKINNKYLGSDKKFIEHRGRGDVLERGKARENASMDQLIKVFNRMIDTGSSSMQRIGDFADKSLAGTGTESLVSYVLRGEGDRTDEKTSASQIDSSVKQPLLRHAATPMGGGSAQGNEPRSKSPSSSILPDEAAGEAKEAGRIRDSQPDSTNANDCPVTPPSTSGSMSPLIPSPHRPGGNEAYCLLSAKELPEWFEPYGFAFEGYRVGLTTPQTWHSVFRCHNETQNIWTEFGPLFAFCVLSVWVMQGWDITRQAPSMDRGFILLCLAGSLIVRPLVSGLAHTFAQQSHRAYAGWWAADFVSICLAISCSSVLMARFTFYCQCDRQLFYIIGLVGLLTSTIISVISVASSGVRIASFILLVLIANGVPLGWQIYAQIANESVSEVVPAEYLMLWGLALGTMAVGLIVRGCSIPEVCCPGTFDYCGHSHMYWHCCINGGFVIMVVAIHKYLVFRQEVRCAPSAIDWCNNGTWMIPVNVTS